jgi:hypothetical protein
MRSIPRLPLVLLTALAFFAPASAEAQTEICAPLPPGLIAWWRGESNTTDVTGTHDGTLHGEPTFGPGKVGQAFVLDGFDDAIDVPYASGLAPTTITVGAWIKPALTRPYAMAAVKMNGTNDYSGFALELSADGTQVLFWVNVLGEGWVGGPGWVSAPPMPITPGIWTHVTGVYDGNDIHLYVNGVDTGFTHEAGIMQPPDGGALTIGGDPYANSFGHPNGREFEGQIDEVQLFDRALSASEIHSIYAAGSAGICTTTGPLYTATIQQPVNADGSSVFAVRRGVVPIKFRLSANDVSTCQLPAATIAVFRTAGGTLGAINESDFLQPSDSGANYRIDGCQYIYNLGSSGLGAGTYLVQLKIADAVVGTGTFSLK